MQLCAVSVEAGSRAESCSGARMWAGTMVRPYSLAATTPHSYALPVPFIAMETTGSNCFYQSLSVNAGPFPSSPLTKLGEGVEILHDATHDVNFARLPKLNSHAGSLGASWPSPGVVKMALERKGGVKSVCVSDEMAMQTAVAFAGAC